MTAPAWIDALVRDFGRSAGLEGFALNERGAAAMTFENGLSLRFEYTGGALVTAVTAPCGGDAASARRILHYAHPDARTGGFRIRAGLLRKGPRAVFAVRLDERDATLPAVNAAFETLWNVAREAGGAA